MNKHTFKNFLLAAFALVFALCAEQLIASDGNCADFRRIYIARHGQRVESGDPHLTHLGIRQAQLLGERIKSIGFDGSIYVSPYIRTIETGIQIGTELGRKVILEPDIQERAGKKDADELKVRTHEELMEMFPNKISETPKLKYPWLYEDHSGKVLEERVENAIDRLLKTTKGDIILIGHGATVKAATKALGKRANVKLNFDVWNCMLVYFIIDADGGVHYISSSTDFLPPQDITSNKRRMLTKTEAEKSSGN